MPRRGWVTVALPEELVRIIDQVVASGKFGYRSRQDFVIDAVRIRLRELGYLK